MVIYILKINFALMLLYGFYRAMMTRDTFFGYRRIALLSILGLSVAVPMMNIQPMLQQNATALSMATVYADYVLPVVPVYASGPAFTWMDAVEGLYIIGVMVLAVRFLFQLGSILRQAYVTPVVDIDGVSVHRLGENHSPFSFFRWIFVCPETQSSEQLHEILVHEQAHVSQLHSVDVLLSELFCVINWFNPFCYLMKREIRLNLEYLADEAVLDEGNARKTYQYHLLGLAYHPSRCDLTNNFNVLPLKNRIKMMNKRRTNEIGKAKYLLFIPLAAGLLAVSNVEMIARTLSEDVPAISSLSNPAKPVPTGKAKLQDNATPAEAVSNVEETVVPPAESQPQTKQDDDKVYDVVEQLPSFNGGMNAMMKYMVDNVKYPAECHKEGVQGRVVVQFVVRKDGTINGVKVVRSVDPRLDAEAMRVVSGMPNWKPGMQKGKPVAVKYNVPIAFKLSSDSSTPAQNTGAPSTPDAN
ncbi:MAG: M56 family metallopeptidase [Prevotella sp.]|nr:M56 family metallopeptidase [Prevotella sp.]